MVYSFRELTDRSVWNSFLKSIPNNAVGAQKFSFIQSLEWLEFQNAVGRKTMSIGVFDEKNFPVGVAAIVFINAKRGSYLYIRNGPVIDWNNKDLVQQLVSFLKNLAKKNNMSFIRVSPLVDKDSKEQDVINSFNFHSFEMNDVEALDTWIMDISDGEDDVFSTINKKTRYEIRKAEKITDVFITNDSKYIDDFYEIELDTVKRNGWTAYTKEYIKKEFETFAKDRQASLVLIKYADRFISGGIFIHYLGQSYYHYGASLTEFRHIPGSYRVIWEAIKDAKEHGSTLFNFWGITPENAKQNHPWQGLTQFKKKFPGIEQRWNPAKDIPVSFKYYFTKAIEKVDKIRKGY